MGDLQLAGYPFGARKSRNTFGKTTFCPLTVVDQEGHPLSFTRDSPFLRVLWHILAAHYGAQVVAITNY
jgi:hypothetical protein